jgi:hypothetical protein
MPPEREIRLRLAAWTPSATCGIEPAVSGGHAFAQAPEQLDLPLLSATQI